MKKIILAFDSFKGSVGSAEIALRAQQAIGKQLPNCEVVTFPIADGGEGTTEAICKGLQAQVVSCSAHDPLMNPIEVLYGIANDGDTAILEMAAASGLPLLSTADRNPMNTTTFGTGEIILDALKRGCRHFIMGIGGSATNDAGTGMLTALGFRFLDKGGTVLDPVGRNLSRIEQIDDSLVPSALRESSFTIACDVTNPFYGPQGAASVFAPQKGASAHDVELLDNGLKHYADLLFQLKGIDVHLIPGAGAAGGMGGGILPFLNATLQSGIDTILDILHFEKALDEANLVITGEGKMDAQTGMGKALGGILRKAQQKNVPVIALGGAVEDVSLLNEMGFTAVFSIQPYPVTLEKAMQREFALENIERTVTQIIRIIER